MSNRKSMSHKLKLAVLSRDNFTCQQCGRHINEGVELHIDHIYPVAKGGTNDINNLQVLCRDCNLRKSDKVKYDVDLRKILRIVLWLMVFHLTYNALLHRNMGIMLFDAVMIIVLFSIERNKK